MACSFVLPTLMLVALLHSYGVAVLVDGALAAGQVELDLDAIHADFYVAACNAWTYTCQGAAACSTSRCTCNGWAGPPRPTHTHTPQSPLPLPCWSCVVVVWHANVVC